MKASYNNSDCKALATISSVMAATDVFKVSILGKESIHCGFHLIPYIARTVLTTLPSSTYVLITDTNVANFHLDAFENEFNSELDKNEAAKARFFSLAVAPGETIKSREGKAYIEDFLLANKCTRDTVILALGGGVIGDLVGFVAATLYVRRLRQQNQRKLITISTACAECALCRYQRAYWPWSTPALAGKQPSIPLTARTSSARFGSPNTSSSTLHSWKPFRLVNFPMEWQK